MSGSKIEIVLDGNIVDALYAASDPSSSNRFITANEVPTGTESITYKYNDFITGNDLSDCVNTAAGGGAINNNQPPETETNGIALYQTPAGANIRAGGMVGVNAILLDLFSSSYISFKIRKRLVVVTGGFVCWGWGIENTLISNINAIEFYVDPLNVTGTNPGLSTNYLIRIRKSSVNTVVVNTGIAQVNRWHNWEIKYYNAGPERVEFYRDNVLLYTETTSINIPGSIASGAFLVNQGIKPRWLVHNSTAPGVINNLRVDKYLLYINNIA